MRVLSLLLAAAVAGLLSSIAVFTMFHFLEDKKPILKDLPPDKVASITKRMSVLVWIVTAVLYVALTYWWK